MSLFVNSCTLLFAFWLFICVIVSFFLFMNVIMCVIIRVLAIHVRFFVRSCAFNAHYYTYRVSCYSYVVSTCTAREARGGIIRFLVVFLLTYRTFRKKDYQKCKNVDFCPCYLCRITRAFRKKTTRKIHVFVHVFAGNSTNDSREQICIKF